MMGEIVYMINAVIAMLMIVTIHHHYHTNGDTEGGREIGEREACCRCNVRSYRQYALFRYHYLDLFARRRCSGDLPHHSRSFQYPRESFTVNHATAPSSRESVCLSLSLSLCSDLLLCSCLMRAQTRRSY